MIKEIIKPENELEEQIVADSEFIEGAMFGEPREGHPEGKVVYHIEEVLENADKYSSQENRKELRFIAMIHDTFKNKVDESKSKSGENHHAMIARRFAEKYTNDTKILDIIELHDEAYNSWCKGDRDNKWDKAEIRANKLIERLGDSIELYLTFYKCDNETGNKRQDCVAWFQELCSKVI